MTYRHKLGLLVGASLLLASCSSERRHESEAVTTADVGTVTGIDIRSDSDNASSARMAPAAPAINVTAAPGVAFRYEYAVTLADKSISAVQEQHAAACEALGPTQCRITGMRYRVLDEDHIRGELSFKLAPQIARGFGRDAIAAVEKAKGQLINASIEGTDVGATMAASSRQSDNLRSNLADLERRLATKGLSDEERSELTRQIERLRASLRQESQVRETGQEMLASTPMTISYIGSQDYSPGDTPVRDAMENGRDSFAVMIAFVLTVLAVGLPWALLAGVLYWALRPLLRRWKARSAANAKHQPPIVSSEE